jgi:hypothetical protein
MWAGKPPRMRLFLGTVIFHVTDNLANVLIASHEVKDVPAGTTGTNLLHKEMDFQFTGKTFYGSIFSSMKRWQERIGILAVFRKAFSAIKINRARSPNTFKFQDAAAIIGFRT